MSSALEPGAGLTPKQKREILARLLEQKAATPRKFPLTLMQQPLWFLEKMAPGRPTYHLHAGFTLEGSLDVEALRGCLNEIVRRHETLRTRFATVGGQPFQVISPPQPYSLPIDDLLDVPANEREQVLNRLAAETAHRPCDLEQGPLWRARLLRLGPNSHVLLLMMHHIISDGWSLGVLANEISTLYSAFHEGRPSPLPELGVQYADYAVWQRQRLDGPVLQSLLSYWRNKLSGHPPALELPTCRPRPAVQTHRGKHRRVYLPKELVKAARALSLRENATLFMTMLAAFKAVLARWARQEDILVGCPSANRTRPELEPLIGYFSNMLVLRTDLSGDPSFRELLHRVRETALGAFAHQELPLEMLVQELQPKRDPSRHPLFQVMFVFQPGRGDLTRSMPGLTIAPRKTPAGVAKFDLQMSLSKRPQGFKASLGYNTDLFECSTITRMLNHFQVLLAAAVADPDRRLSELPLMMEAERQQVLVDWNETAADFARETCMHELFQRQVRRSPDALAVVQGDRRWSYAELNRRANQVACRLQRLGVGPESLVAIYMDRSLEMVAGVFGILKAGGAYVPLDPVLPASRVQFLLQDAQVSVLLTTDVLCKKLNDVRPLILCLDSTWPESNGDEDPAPAASASNPAYVIYTSGSTGQPKGVVIEHRSLVNYAEAVTFTYELTAADKVLQFASISHDAHAEEIYPCLACGGTLVLRTDEMLDSYGAFLRDCERRDLTVLSLPTAYWHELAGAMDAGGLRLPPSVRLVVIGGERAVPDRAAMFLRRMGRGTRLLNTYGPTETTVVATAGELQDSGRDGPFTAPPIGRPLRNVRAYVLDQTLRPSPVGVPGELFLAGDGLARGYLRRPDLSAEQFLPDPYAKQPGSRMYRTGDLVRWLPAGELDFLGRVGEQVKIRGFRVEPREVEAVLNEHPALREAVVVAREDSPGELRLVGYVVPQREPAPTIQDLRGFLKERLPLYMIPAAFVTLPSLPTTPAGKVARQALPPPDPTRSELYGEYVGPRTPVEERLAALWSETLKLQRVGVHDNFFDLGGHSLLAVQLISRVRAEFKVELPLVSLFTGPTVAELAERVVAAERESQPSSPDHGIAEELLKPWLVAGGSSRSLVVPLQASGTEPAFFCVHGLGGQIANLVSLARRLGSDRPFYGVQGRGLAEAEAPHASIEDMAHDYLEAIRDVQPEGPYLLGGWSLGGLVALEMAQRLVKQGQQVPLVVLLDTHLVLRGPTAENVDDAGGLRWIARQLGIRFRDLQSLAPEEQWNAVVQQAQASGMLPADVGADQVQRVAFVCKTHARSAASYLPQPYAERVVLFRAEATVGPRRSSRRPSDADSEATWRALFARMEINQVTGRHHTMLREPHVEPLAEALRNCLSQASPGEPGMMAR